MMRTRCYADRLVYDDWMERLFAASPMVRVVDPPYSIACALERGLVPEMYIPAALAIVEDLNNTPRRPTWGLPARSLYNDPGWDNVVRAAEEDR